ncbi:MAG: ribonuclease III, partial [Candidatus Methylomirabilis sp.]
LEFLGDAVWSFFVSDALVALWPTAPEGELTLRRARLIRAPALAQMAKVHGLASLLALSAGEESTGGRQKVSILSSAFEAVIGSIYLDGGTEAIRRLACDACLNQLSHSELVHDPKTALQELTQSRFRRAPRYRMLRRKGPPHAPMFEVEVRVGRSAIGQGSGRSKQEAERAAAASALAAFFASSPTTSSSDSRADH